MLAGLGLLWILHFACRRLESREGEIGEEIFCKPVEQGGGV